MPSGVEHCIDCSNNLGKRFVPSCLTCAMTDNPGRCSSCLKMFYPAMTCRSASYANCYKPDLDNPCQRCETGAAGAGPYEKCIACFLEPKKRADCETCTTTKSAAEQQQCYACTSKAKYDSSEQAGGCGGCFTQTTPGPLRTQCLSCASAVPVLQQRYCSTCVATSMTSNQTARCFKCLRTSQAGAACQECAIVTSTDAAYSKCVACNADANNRPDCHDCSALTTDAARVKCYSCVLSSKLKAPADAGMTPLSSCSQCIGTAHEADCVACNMEQKVPAAVKAWCAGCMTVAGAAGSRQTCVKCLQQTKLADVSTYAKVCNIAKR